MILRKHQTHLSLLLLIAINLPNIMCIKSLETEDITNDRSDLDDMDDDIDADVGITKTAAIGSDGGSTIFDQRKPIIRKIIKFHRKYSTIPIDVGNETSEELVNVADVEDVAVDNYHNASDRTTILSSDLYEISYVDPVHFIDPTYLNQMQRLSALNGSNLGVVFKWSKWEKWSKCSRACGGGVQMRKRNCIEERPVGTDMETNEYEPIANGTRRGCVGIFKRFRICNDKPCEYETPNSFRNEQCEAYNDSPFRGKYYYWEHYYKEDNECELNCKPIGEKYYATLNKTVTDGTPCKRPAVYYTHYFRRRAVCVQGICKAVHSSGAIRSVTTNDSPYQCGSMLCRPVFETFRKKHIPHGYLYVTTVAAGASNISVMQMDHSENLLVLKSAEDHHFIINGNDEPAANGIYKYHGNLFEYRRGDDYELIQATGPISKAVDLMIHVKGPNPGIQYEYFLPIASGAVSTDDETATSWNEHGAPLDYSDESKSEDLTTVMPVERKRKRFMWKLIGFGPCSRSCGGGIQPPIFRCIRDSPTRFYSPRRCHHMEKPTFNELIYKCNTQPCPAYWHTEEWEDCFCRLGKGVRSREVKCVQEIKGGIAIQVDDEICSEEKPPTKEYCSCSRRKITARSNKPNSYEYMRGTTHAISLNRNYNNGTLYPTTAMPSASNKLKRNGQKNFREDPNDKSGMWLMSDWNQKCSADCNWHGGLDGFEHRSIFCDRTPPYTDRCDLQITPDTSRPCQNSDTCTYGTWFAGKWSKCHGDCFNLMRRRSILCIKNEAIVDEEECQFDNRPLDREACQINDVDYCKPKWHYSEWTECSHPCGGGSQKRFGKCLEIDVKENILRESNKCRYIDREPVVSTCNTEKCAKEPEDDTDEDKDDSNAEKNELKSSECTDQFSNCHLIANREKYCTLSYYKRYCCKSCELFTNYV